MSTYSRIYSSKEVIQKLQEGLETDSLAPSLSKHTELEELPRDNSLAWKKLRSAELPGRGPGHLGSLKEPLLPVELRASCAASFRRPAFMSCHPCWAFGDAAVFKSFLPPWPLTVLL